MKKSSLITMTAFAAVAVLGLSGCATDAAPAGSARACVILPDADSGTRWETGDRPALQKGLEAAGFEADIQNAQKDPAKYATIAEAQLTKGCGIMLLVDYQKAAEEVVVKAKAQGVPVIAYDRPIPGADYYISFDNETVGAMQGQMIVDGLGAAGKDITTASIIYSYGDPSDGNAGMFKKGAVDVLTAAGAKPAFEMKGTWDAAEAGTLFEQAFTAVGGKVDAVLAPNDPNADAIISVLDKNGLTVPVSGQDALPAGLQNVLLGKQFATVWKPFSLQVEAALKVITAILNGETYPTEKTNDGVPFVTITPNLITAESVKDVVASGDVKVDQVCTAALAAKCAEYGVK
jgi:D-xylose transport system substrate-binding protein